MKSDVGRELAKAEDAGAFVKEAEEKQEGDGTKEQIGRLAVAIPRKSLEVESTYQPVSVTL